MRRACAGLMGMLLIGSFGSAGGDAVKDEVAKMQGTWQFVAHEKDGKALPEDDVKKLTVTVKDDTWTVKFGDAVVQAGTQKLDPSKKPKTTDSKITEGEGKGTTMLGIYKVEGNTMTVCFDATGKTRPKAFKTEPDSGYFLAVVKRIEK